MAERSYVPIRQNVPDSRRSGLEAILNSSLSTTLSLDASITYLTTNVDLYSAPTGEFEDVSHIFSPDWMIRAGLSYRPDKSFRMHLNGRYVAESFMELSNSADFAIPSFFVLNGRIGWTLNDQLDIDLFVNNILDEQYFTDGAPVDLDFDGESEGPGFRIQPPRHFHVMLGFRF